MILGQEWDPSNPSPSWRPWFLAPWGLECGGCGWEVGVRVEVGGEGEGGEWEVGGGRGLDGRQDEPRARGKAPTDARPSRAAGPWIPQQWAVLRCLPSWQMFRTPGVPGGW